MRRKVSILLSFTLMLTVAAPVIAAPTSLGKISLVKSKNKKVQVNREGRWIQVSQGADLFADDLLKPEPGATVRIKCTIASSTNSDDKRVPAGIPSSVNTLCPNVTTTTHKPNNGRVCENSRASSQLRPACENNTQRRWSRLEIDLNRPVRNK